MKKIRQNFVVIQRRDFAVLVDNISHGQRWCPIVKTVTDVNDLIQRTTNERERNNAITATRFNLPFVIGENLVIPVNTNTNDDDSEHEGDQFLTIFGGQILREHDVGE